MVNKMTNKDCCPTRITLAVFISNPNRTTASCNMYLDVNLIPLRELTGNFIREVIKILKVIPNTAPPITGTIFPQVIRCDRDCECDQHPRPVFPDKLFQKRLLRFLKILNYLITINHEQS